MSWFERRQAEAEAQAQAPPPEPEPEPEPEPAQGQSQEDAVAAALRAAAPLFDDEACSARVLSCDSEHAAVELCGRSLRLDLRFPSGDPRPAAPCSPPSAPARREGG